MIEERIEVGADPGIVRSQSVAAEAEVVPETEIDLVVSEKGAKVPSLKGLTLSKARTVLSSANLILGDDTKQASSATVNTIIDQDPDPNDIVRVNSEVDVVLAMKEIRYSTVPDVKGLKPAEAANRVRSAGFKNVEYSGQGSYVWGEQPTNPRAGTSYPCDTTVTINTAVE